MLHLKFEILVCEYCALHIFEISMNVKSEDLLSRYLKSDTVCDKESRVGVIDDILVIHISEVFLFFSQSFTLSTELLRTDLRAGIYLYYKYSLHNGI